jgi:hypothetical protein
MCPDGSAVLFQFAVVWQMLQSFGASSDPWCDRRAVPADPGLAAPM